MEDHLEQPPDGPDASLTSPGPSITDRLALLASYVQPDGSLRIPGLAVIDPNGIERIVVQVDDRSAKVGLRVGPSWSPAGSSEVYLYAEDGDDEDPTGSPPEVGLHATIGGNGVISLSAALTSFRGVMGAGEPELHLFPWDRPNPQ